MLDAILEEDEVHRGVVDVVHLQLLVESGDECGSLREFDVLPIGRLVVAEEEVFVVLEDPFHSEIVLQLLVGKLAVSVAISLVDKTISEDSERLVDPQVDQAAFVLEILKADHQDTLDDLG